MSRVIIQPSYGNAAARRDWAATLDREREFNRPPLRQLLTEDQHAALLEQHPSGRTRFWGATKVHDTRMQTLTTGDVVLFTGGKLIRAVGEVGVSFPNSALADALWTPDPEKGSWRNVYSLLTFEQTDIPYEEIWALEGFNQGDNFMRLRFLDDEKTRVVLDGLRITTTTQLADQAAAEHALAAAPDGSTRVVPPETVNKGTTSYETAPKHVFVNRAEALLVQSYQQSLPTGLEVHRLRTPVGVTDLHVTGPDLVEIIEAKAGSTHQYVRLALGQLLDYAAHSPTMPTRLTALFPDRPANVDITLLHRYGIDCVYRERRGSWTRESTTAERFKAVRWLCTEL